MRISARDLSYLLGASEHIILTAADQIEDVYADTYKEVTSSGARVNTVFFGLHDAIKIASLVTEVTLKDMATGHYQAMVDKIRKFKKRYNILYSKTDKLFTLVESDGKMWVSSNDLVKAAQIRDNVARWVSSKSRILELKKGVDFYLHQHGYRRKKTEYLFTVEAAIKMLKGVKYSETIKENLIHTAINNNGRTKHVN